MNTLKAHKKWQHGDIPKPPSINQISPGKFLFKIAFRYGGFVSVSGANSKKHERKKYETTQKK